MLLLASASPARRRLLEQAAIPHRVQVSGVDEESVVEADPRQLVQRLAEAKAQAVAQIQAQIQSQPQIQTQSQSVARNSQVAAPVVAVLGCDSVLVFAGEVYGKPRDGAEAISRWQRMAGAWGELHTGHCLIPVATGDALTNADSSLATSSLANPQLAVVTTRVQFAPLSQAEIEAYVATGEPLQCAGGFALEGRGGMLVERIEGCFSNVIGLSLPLLRRWLSCSAAC